MTKIKKVLILGIDAIEYDLVEKWDLQHLKQKEYGKTILPIYPGEEPNTRIIWPCFITGKMPAQMGYVTGRVFKQPLQSIINMFLPRIKFLSNPQRTNPENYKKRKESKEAVITTKIYSFLNKIDITRKPEKKDIKASTLFDNDKCSIHTHIPIFDEYIPAYAGKVIQAIENDTYRAIFEIKCKEEINIRSKEIFTNLKEQTDWKIYMQYFWCLDGIQHIYFHKERKIAEYYIMFDELIKKINKQITNDTLLLIVSDHGQKKGIHTPYGFYSINKPLQLQNPKLIDFKWIIEQTIGLGK